MWRTNAQKMFWIITIISWIEVFKSFWFPELLVLISFDTAEARWWLHMMQDYDYIWYKIMIIYDTRLWLYMMQDYDYIWYKIMIIYDTRLENALHNNDNFLDRSI